MTKTLAEVTQYAKQLEPTDRLKLASTLLCLSDEPASSVVIEKEWDTEIRRRMSEYRAGKVRTVPWEKVKRRLRRKAPK